MEAVGQRRIKNKDFHWLVGILEGEGTFYSRWQLGSKRVDGSRSPATKNFVIRIAMTDQDVVTRAATIMGVKVHGPYKRPFTNYKPVWHCQVHRKTDVKEWCQSLYKYMGQRRQQQVKSLLAFVGGKL